MAIFTDVSNGTVSDSSQIQQIINEFKKAVPVAEFSETQTMSGTVTLTDSNLFIQKCNCNGAARIVKLPAYATTNHGFLIVNATGAAYTLDVQSSAGVSLLAAALADGETASVLPDGAAGYKLMNPKSTPGVGDGWTAGTGTWSYSSADSPTFVISINADVTALIGVGDRIKLTQTTAKYFIVTAVGAFSGGNTLVTVYGGTDYTLANAAITLPYYSHVKNPFGFNSSPEKWTQRATYTSNTSQVSAVANTWYNIGSVSLSIPIGAWKVEYWSVLEMDSVGSGFSIFSTLSTANNSESDADFSLVCTVWGQYASLAAYKSKVITLAAKTAYYLNHKHNGGTPTLDLLGSAAKVIVQATCAYL